MGIDVGSSIDFSDRFSLRFKIHYPFHTMYIGCPVVPLWTKNTDKVASYMAYGLLSSAPSERTVWPKLGSPSFL